MRKVVSFLRPVVLICLTLVAPAPLLGQISLQEVTDLRFRGNRTYPSAALANAIITRETECRSFVFLPLCLAGADFSLDPHYLSERELRRDHARVRLFYWLRGYRETVVDTLVTRSDEGKTRITFDIQEGEPIRVENLEYHLLGEISDSSVLEDLPLREGEPLSLVALDATVDTLQTRLRNQGFAHVAVFRGYDIPSGSYHAQVTFDVDPGPLVRFGDLTVEVFGTEGRQPTIDETVVRRLLPFKEGDIFSEELRFTGQRSLYRLDLFRAVSIEPDSVAPTDPVLPFSIELHEGDVHRVRGGGGLSNAECFNVEVRWSSLNFRGGARRLQLTGRVSNILADDLGNTILCREAGTGKWGEETYSVSVDFTQPWFFSPRNTISASVFLERQSVPNLFVQKAVGLTFGLTHSLTPSTVLGGSSRPRFSFLDADQVFFCSVYLICDKDEIGILQESHWLSPLAVSISRERRDQVLNPTRGHSAFVDLEHAAAWTGSDFRYTRVLSEATWHTRNRGRWVLGTRLRGGWVSPRGFEGLVAGGGAGEVLHPEKRFFSGGANSVRGFGQNRLGPSVLFLENVKELVGTESDENVPCAPQEVMDGSCSPTGVSDGEFKVQPRGGTRILEGSVELRFPLNGSLWEGATFLDFGQVWAEEETIGLNQLEFTPGFGIRFFSPIGPIRVDLAYRFAGAEPLPVVTRAIEPYDPAKHSDNDRLKYSEDSASDYAKTGDLILLTPKLLWDSQVDRWDLSRFQLHLSIGQAF
jgi:outer membrane protein insertion porin family/translocation and assembly module TamA